MLKRLSCLLSVVFLSACTAVNSGVGGMFNFDTDLKLVFSIADNINPDEQDNASPLFVRFYELKSDKAFNQADFFSLYEDDQGALGEDMLGKRELKRMAPGEAREERFVVAPDTRYVALFAEFFQFKDAKYKVIFPVTSKNIVRNTIRIEIQSNNLILKSAN